MDRDAQQIRPMLAADLESAMQEFPPDAAPRPGDEQHSDVGVAAHLDHADKVIGLGCQENEVIRPGSRGELLGRGVAMKLADTCLYEVRGDKFVEDANRERGDR